MTNRFADRVKQTTSTIGTGPYTLSPPPKGGWTTVASIPGIVAGDTVDAVVVGGDQWEVGTYTYQAGGTMARTTIDASSSAGAPVSWPAGGPREFFVTLSSKRIAEILASLGTGGASINDAVTSGTSVWSSTKVAAAIAAAINAIDFPDQVTEIADGLTATNKTWSSTKVDAELQTLADAISAIPEPGASINDATTASGTTWSSAKIQEEVAAFTEIDDEVSADDSTWSSEKIVQYIDDAIEGTTTPPPATPALTPANGSAAFDQDVAGAFDVATSNVALSGINVSSAALPAGLSASVVGGGTTLRISGTPTAAAASDTYLILVNRASGGGTLAFTLTLVVNAAPVVEDWTYLKNETETFNLDEAMKIRFGDGDDWVEATVPAGDGYTCNLELIQVYNPEATDPKPFFTKHCEISPVPSGAPAVAKLTGQRVETSYFDPDGYDVPWSDRANLQSLINTHGSVNLLEAKDYAQDITIGTNQKIHMIPKYTWLNSITVAPGATGFRINGGGADLLTFPASASVTHDGVVSNCDAPIRSIGARLEDVTFINMSGQHYLNSSTSAGGWTKGCTFIKCWEQLAGIFQDQFGAQDAGFTLIGSSGRGDDRNVIISSQALNPWNDAIRVEGQKTVTIIGHDMECYYEPHNGANARVNFANCGTVNVMATGGNTFSGAIKTGADVTNIIHSIFNPFIKDAQDQTIQRPHVRMQPGAQVVAMWGSYSTDPSYIEDNTGGTAVFMRNDTGGGLFRNGVKQANNAVLSGAQNTQTYAWLVPPAPQAAEVWAKVPQYTYADPLGSGWAATRAGKTDEGPAIQALLDANDVVILEPRAYYVSTRFNRRRGKTLMGAIRGGQTSIVALNDTVNISGTYYPENFNGGDNVIGIAFYGGRSQLIWDEPQTQWYGGYLGYNTHIDPVMAGRLLDKSYAWDHSFNEYNTFLRGDVGHKQLLGTGAINGPTEMYSDKTTGYRNQYLSQTDRGISMDVLRSNNGMAEVEPLFKDGGNGAVYLNGGHNYMIFVNPRIITCGGANPIDFPPYHALSFVGGEFVAHADNDFCFTQACMVEGMEFKRNGNTTVRLVDPTRHLFEMGSGFTSGFFNCFGDIPLGSVETGAAAVLAINCQFPTADGLWSAALSNISYETLGTPSGGDDVRTANLAWVQGPIVPGTRFLARTPIVGGSTPPPDPDPEDPDELIGLNRFRANFAPGDVIASVGDSTAIRADFNQRMNEQTLSPGGELEGAQLLVRAFNGQTVEMIDDAFDEIATHPNVKLIIFRAGINNVRIGTDSTASLTLKYQAAIERAQSLIPGADILLTIPNSLLSTDPTGEGWVQPATAQARQDYTNRMYDAGKAIEAMGYDHVYVYDSQTGLYGRTSPATSPYMGDQLHPNGTGQWAEHAQIVPLITPFPTPIDLTASAAAWASNPTNPETIYARAWEDTRYATLVREMLITGNFPGFKLLYIGRRGNDTAPLSEDMLQTGDALWTPYGAYRMTGSESKTNFGTAPYVSFQMTYPSTFPTSAAPVNARIYRPL